ncbi:MAG: hypothetical protein QGG23_08295 [Candidatus Bathyarchaeota archaeon]|jgi:hypothetical protein|nr:hypothetical protein [Candidatus Bathyarchaeota archaeon]|tara:strand:+ start:134 stop:394 length:261 start_codon:yes stop_codon:yes gene_type:complete
MKLGEKFSFIENICELYSDLWIDKILENLTRVGEKEVRRNIASACDSSNEIITELEENINILIREVKTKRKNKLSITSNKYLIAEI